jgi:uncharacterized protein DUF6152
MRLTNLRIYGLTYVIVLLGTILPVRAHHSFAMYDQTVTKTLTGKLTRFVIGANHSQLIFEILDDEGKTSVDPKTGKTMMWQVETGSAANIARQGITVASFPYGTIFHRDVLPASRRTSSRRRVRRVRRVHRGCFS